MRNWYGWVDWFQGNSFNSRVPARTVLILLRPNLLPMMAKRRAVVLRRHGRNEREEKKVADLQGDQQ